MVGRRKKGLAGGRLPARVVRSTRLDDRIPCQLRPLLTEVDIPARTVLAHPGSIRRQAFLIIDGRAEILVESEPVANAGPGSLVGEMPISEDQPRSATVKAQTPMKLLVVGPGALPWLAEYPEVAQALATEFARFRQPRSAVGTAGATWQAPKEFDPQRECRRAATDADHDRPVSGRVDQCRRGRPGAPREQLT